MSVQLRDYQQRAITDTFSAMRAGSRSVLIQSPTGTGKGRLAAALLQKAHAGSRVSLFAVHRKELVDQVAGDLLELGIEGAVIMPGHPNPGSFEPTYLGTIQSITARRRRGSFDPARVNLILVDEAHHAASRTYTDLLAAYPNAKLVGLTATPTRTDGRGLGRIFDTMVQAISYSEAFERGYLVRPRYFAPSTPDLTNVPTVGGDYDEGVLEALLNTPELVGDVGEHYARHALDRKGIVFATGVAHSKALSLAFIEAGIPAFHLDGKTSADERAELLGRFRAGELQVFCNCQVATEGFDVPDVSAVVLARPTQSPIFHLQTCGRGLRPAPGKQDCIVLDHSGNTLTLGPVESYETWTLDTGKGANTSKRKNKEKKPKQLVCEACSAVFERSRVCPECGHVHMFEAIPEDVLTAQGDLREIGMEAASAEHQDRVAWYGQLLGYGASRGYSSGWAYHKFRAKFPAGKPPVGVRPQMPCAEVLAFIRSENVRWRLEQKRAQEGAHNAAAD